MKKGHLPPELGDQGEEGPIGPCLRLFGRLIVVPCRGRRGWGKGRICHKTFFAFFERGESSLRFGFPAFQKKGKRGEIRSSRCRWAGSARGGER